MPPYAGMLNHMRTTLNLPDDLYRSARVRAAQEGRTVTSVMEEALRAFLDQHAPEPEPYRVRPLKMGIPGEIPFDLNDNAAVRAYLDDQDPRGYVANS